MASRKPSAASPTSSRPDLKRRAAALRAKAKTVTRGSDAKPTPRLPDPPTDLARACTWAIEHRAWLDHADLDEAGMLAEIERGDAVFFRAAAEPSRGLPDLVAKARMLLNDLVAMDALDPTFADQRLIPVVLRELIAMGETPTGATQATALVAEIEREWPLMAAADNPSDRSPEAEAAFGEAYARRKALLDAVEALPCDCREARHAKALALAWYEWAQLGLSMRREDGDPDDRLVFDIHASLAGPPHAVGAEV